MNETRRITTKRPGLILLALLFLAVVSAGCASRGLPSKAESALRVKVVEWAGAEGTFEIAAVQKAGAQKAGADSGEVTVPTGVNPDTTQLGACPPAGTSETWCVVIAPAITDREGNRVSRFLVQSQGRYWDAQKLLDTDRSVFEAQGCTNWGAP